MQISDQRMASDATRHFATRQPDGMWVVSWLPGRALSYDEAVTAMTLAEAVAQMQDEGLSRVVDYTHRLWACVDGWAAALGLSGPDAVVRASEPPADADGW